MQRWADEMGRLFVGDLQDKLREIRFGDFDAIRFEHAIEMNFLGSDGLAFDDQLRGAPVADVENVAAGVLGSGGDKKKTPPGSGRGVEGLNQLGEVRAGIVFV